MAKNGIKSKNLIIALLSTVLVLCIALGVIFQSYTYNTSHATEISITKDGDVTVYVSGMHVRRNEDGTYYIDEPDTTHTCSFAVMVVNERAVSSKLNVTIRGEVQTVTSPNYFETSISGTPSIEISVETKIPETAGSSFSTAYPVSTGEDFIALSKILMSEESDVTEANKLIYNGFLDCFNYAVKPDENGTVSRSAVQTNLNNARNYLKTAYFMLTENVLLNASISDLSTALTEGFFGVGALRGEPFSGCFDFNGHYVNMVVTATEMGTDAFAAPEMVSGTADHEVMSIGLFGNVSGDNNNACIIRNANVRGSIAVTSDATKDDTSDKNKNTLRIYAGGLAGKIGDGVALENIVSSVSLSVTAKDASVYAGGIFGFSSADIEYWCDVLYDGTYATVEARTDGAYATAMVGGLAGILQNAYVHAFTATLDHANLIATALGTGDAMAGGLAAIAYLAPEGGNIYADCSERSAMEIAEIDINAANAVISAQTNYANASGVLNIKPAEFISESLYGASIAGGLVGVMFNQIAQESDDRIALSDIHFNDISASDSASLSVQASTQFADSNGVTFAGGMIGYIYDDPSSADVGAGIDYRPSDAALEETGGTIFGCNISVSSVQNGYGPAYAGGIFGYGAFRLRPNTGDSTRYTFNLTDKSHSVDIEAVQTSTTRMVSQNKDALNDVVAGFYSSRLPKNYFINYFNFNVYNGNVSARREAGSTAIGDVAAGGLAGQAFGDNSSTITPFRDMNVTLHESSVQALGYSFNSDYGENKEGNNVFAGGFIGYAEGYGYNTSNTAAFGFNNISLTFTGVSEEGYSVYCVQNAISSKPEADDGYGNYCTEGYAGGMFGLLAQCNVTNLQFIGDESKKSLIYLSATNDPDTVGVGGIIGSIKLFKISDTGANRNNHYSTVQNCSVENAHVAGTAFSNKQTSGGNHDIYAGGAIGSISTCVNSGHTIRISGLKVDNCAIESVGEQKMITYAGGVIGGIYYLSQPAVSNCIVTNSSVIASSASYGAISGGVIGLLQKATLTNCHAIDTYVKAFNVLKETPESKYSRAYAAGIAGRNAPTGRNNNTISNCYTNASVTAEGNYSVKAGICVMTEANSSVLSYNFYVAANVFENLDGAMYYTTSNGTNKTPSDGTGAGITLDGDNELSLSNIGSYVTIFPDTEHEIPGEKLVATVNDNSLAKVESVQVEVGSGWWTEYEYVKRLTCTTDKETNVQVTLSFTFDEVTYNLCTYTVPLNGGSSSVDTKISVTSNVGNDIAAATFCYTQSGNYTYFRIHVGNEKKATSFTVSSTGGAHPVLYETTEDLLGRDETAAPNVEDITKIVNNAIDGRAKQYSYFKDKASIGYVRTDSNEMYFEPEAGAFEHYAIVFAYDTQYIVIEVVPNELTSIKVTPSRDTPARGETTVTEGGVETTYYIYAPEDTVRLDAKTIYAESFDQNIVDVHFSYGGTGTQPNGVTVRPNGTVEFANVPVGTLVPVKCSSVGNDGAISTIIYLYISAEIVVDAGSLTGARYMPAGNVHGVQGQPFTFTLTPTAGYGLNPVVTLTRTGGVNDSLKLNFPERREDLTKAQITAGEFTFVYNYNSVTGVYTITLPAEYMANGVTNVNIDADFDKVFTLVFDLGAWADASGLEDVERRVTYTLKGSTSGSDYVLNETLYNGIKNIIGNDVDRRYGFTFAGFYNTDDAATIEAYGKSFEEMCQGQGETLYSSRTFYARWNYTVILDAPDGVGLAGTDIIPVNTLRGFTFNFAAPSWFAGTPRFDVYIATHNQNGEISGFTAVDQQSSADFYTDDQGNYVIGASRITGTILIKVYQDNISLGAGETSAVGANSIRLRADGVFTAFYGVNFGEAQSSLSATVFEFSAALPAGTSVRLFTQYDNVAYSVGYLTLGEARTSLSTQDFIGTDKNGTHTEIVGTLPASVRSAGYYLVVTLPINSNSVSGAMDVSANYQGTLSVGVKTYYNVAAGTDYPEPPQDGGASATVNFATATVYGITPNGTTLTMSIVKEGASDVVDLRRAGKFHMWRIIGNNLPAAKFSGEVFRTTESRGTVVYIEVTAGGTLNISGLQGAVVELLEVTNTHYPATDVVLGTHTI
ncbi:MAG: hypothetical protein DBX59_08640 [Bacillota bacterium]|nr:MAG: hypothetical protein DBX59_08640 [Bacillota bacterium]